MDGQMYPSSQEFIKRVNVLSVLNTAVYLKLIVKLTATYLMFSSFYYRLIKKKLKKTLYDHLLWMGLNFYR